MPSLNIAYQWAINACNAPNIGYSQNYRYGQTVNGVTYYDCSSFVAKALTEGGFFTTNPWFTTYTEAGYLQQAGFQQVDIHSNWIPGDICLRAEHTEMVYSAGDTPGTGVTMGAHTDGVPLADQVSINSYTSTASEWSSLWRFPGGAIALTWISSNEYLSETEMQNNAYCFYSYMYTHATLNAIAGMLGNMQRESTINPGVWQNLTVDYSMGFGLVQWTPATNYTEWATAQGHDIGDGNGQCEWLLTMTVPSGQWIETAEYPVSWEEFLAYTGTPEDAASIFLANFERAGVSAEEERRQNARKWYDYLENLTPYPPYTPGKRRGYKWVIFNKPIRKRR